MSAPQRMVTLAVDKLRIPFTRILEDAASRVPGWMGALVATVDGRQVTTHHNEAADMARVAAMVGSVVALGETVCRELKFGRSQSLIVSAADGHLLAFRVPASREVLVLGVLARPTATLGLVIHEARHAAQLIGAELDRQQLPPISHGTPAA